LSRRLLSRGGFRVTDPPDGRHTWEALMSDHPAWCVQAFCTIDRPPVSGHGFGAHRSQARVVEATVLRLRQDRSASGPSLELRRGDGVLVLPLGEARDLGPAVDDVLEGAGVEL
jgi:hypothetical protein